MSFLQQRKSSVAVATTPRAPTILVVDDYVSICELIDAMLRPLGYNVLTATSGEEAMAITRNDGTIDLLLTDLEMPRIRGDELADLFQRAHPQTRIILMSALPVVRTSKPFSFLAKPFGAEVLVSKVHEALNQAGANSGRHCRTNTIEQ